MGGWLQEITQIPGRLMMQPLLYWFILLGLIVSFKRVRKERDMFGIRIFDVFAETKGTWVTGFLTGITLSLVMVGAGIVIPFPVILLLSALILLMSLILRLNVLSAAYTLTVGYGIIFLLQNISVSFIPEEWQQAFSGVSLTSITVIMAGGLFLEAIWVLRLNHKETFPELVAGSRGKWIGQHRLKKLGMMPIFVLIPGGAITPFMTWWPLLDIAGGSYGLMVVPFLSGFDVVTKGHHPVTAAKKLGSGLFLLAFLVTTVAIVSYWWEFLSIAAVGLAVVGKLFIHTLYRVRDKKAPYFSANDQGLTVLGIIKNSPAEQMGIGVGDLIERVNQVKVTNEEEFYHAMNVNRALCKMEIRDQHGEIRFTQRAIYQHDPYDLGLLFVKADVRKKAVSH
ncbi:PDZ domain-containing protein [Thalassobacillus devorans]|uniref:PDZ domain-containing protein n=1 Tax=Thalassobacillus devorans TaxID=279813 RepID=UPI000A1CD981|nr:PDZ domain-containing protein [Thalassobacillus devorans]